MKDCKLFIGTSGYSYSHWRKGVFYPRGLRQNEEFLHYQKFFNTVELNVTFYRLPQEKTFIAWYKKSLLDFRFVVKGWRMITHIKRLKDCRNYLDLFSHNVGRLENKVSCILWQLPPSMKMDKERLEGFIAETKKDKFIKGLDQSIEFRNITWFNENIYSLLKREHINLCIAHSSSWPYAEVVTSRFLYLRFHGGQTLYGSEYAPEELKEWAEKTKGWINKYNLKRIYAFFNNDTYGYAVKNALMFRKLLKD